jgi:gas vesicle protein GvpN
MSKSSNVEVESAFGTEGPTAEFIPSAGECFVVTPQIEDLTNRALAYLEIGYPVHLSGPAGTGKSTLAMHIASQLGRPCTLLHGDDEFKSSDLLGRDSGYQRNSMVDNYVSSIVKTEETLSVVWTSNRLTTACQKGHTLIYDEFTRSPATANNPFLSILEEGILNIPSAGRHKGYIKVHRDFRAIFTSNPEEYVGVHKTQDALLDRMITMRIDYQDRETEVAIVRAKSGRTAAEAGLIVDIVRGVRDLLGNSSGPTVRSAIAIAKIADHRGFAIDPDDDTFTVTCKDVLCYHVLRHQGQIRGSVDEIIRRCGSRSDDSSQAAVVAGADRLELPSDLSTPQETSDDNGETERWGANRAPQETSEPPRFASPPPAVHPTPPANSDPVSAERQLLHETQSLRRDLPDASDHGSEDLRDLRPERERSERSLSPYPDESLGGSQTASPREMLEVAVTRYNRPPRPDRPHFPRPERDV